MGPEDGDPGGKRARRPSSTHEDAFALTITPDPGPVAPAKLPEGTSSPEAKTRVSRPGIAIASEPTVAIASDATVAAPSSEPGRQAAAELPPLPEVASSLYRADGEIARGGMGRIVAAEDRRLGRKVAIKELIDPGGDQAARFQREALITARLQHPGIVPVYEAGRWPSGEPFFAMKLVAGKPFDQEIAAAPRLDQRLALLPRLAAACDAIAYAHSQRIVHRDLKPSNVLLGDFGETVVIDWGLAKDLDVAETASSQIRGPKMFVERRSRPKVDTSSNLTIAGAVMGTPAYMPPEQARGEQVDQRADVFALGAMLYHLLAGVPPYNARTATEVLEAAAAGQIVPLVERERRVPRELVAIVERAMAPAAADRYPHAGELAEELRRFLTGQLVDAHRYTAVQKLGRFLKKHRSAVTIAAIAIAGFAIGGTIAIRHIVQARDQAQAAERVATARKIAAEHMIDYTLTHVQTQLTSIGRLDLLAGLGGEVKRYYDKLARIPGGMPLDDQLRMVEAMELIGRAEHTSGKPDQALATWAGARAQIANLVTLDHGPRTFRLRKQAAILDGDAGEIFQERGQNDQAIAKFTEAKREWDQLHDEQPAEHDLLLGAADAHDRLGDLLRTEGKIDEAFSEYSEAKTEREAAASAGNGKVTDEVRAVATSHLKLGSIYQVRGDSSLALSEYRAAERLREQVLAQDPDNVVLREEVLDVEQALADLERLVGDDAAAVASYEQALPVTAALVRRDPSNTTWQRERGNLFADLGFAELDGGRYQDALGHLDQAIAVQKDLAARDPKSTRYRVDLSRSYTRAGDAYLDLGQHDSAIAQYKLALDIRTELVAKDAHSVPFRRSLAWSYAKLGGAYAEAGDVAHAIEAHEQALAIRQDLAAGAPAQGGFKNELASSEIDLGRLVAPRDPARGSELIGKGLVRAQELVDNDPINNEWKDTLVRGLLARAEAARAAGDRATAAAVLEDAVKVAQPAHAHAPQNVTSAVLLGEVELDRAALAAAGGDAKAAAAAWQAASDALEPLAKDGRLPAPSAPLLARVRARR